MAAACVFVGSAGASSTAFVAELSRRLVLRIAYDAEIEIRFGARAAKGSKSYSTTASKFRSVDARRDIASEKYDQVPPRIAMGLLLKTQKTRHSRAIGLARQRCPRREIRGLTTRSCIRAL